MEGKNIGKDANCLYVFTDGGAKDNGKSSCKAAWGVFFSDEHALNEVGKCHTAASNQKAELMAIRMALSKLVNMRKSNENWHSQIAIVTDSKYAIDCCTKWCKRWKMNGWRNYKNQPVEHASLIKECLSFMEEVPVKFIHVNSHCLPPKDMESIEYALWYGNYQVDRMVNTFLAQQQENVPSLPTGKAVYINWDGKVASMDESALGKKKDGKVEDGAIVVTW